MVAANAADSAMMTLSSFPIDLRNSKMPVSASACVAASWLVGETLLGLMTTRRLPMDWVISFSTDFRALKILSVRLSPLVSATLLGAAEGPEGAGDVGVAGVAPDSAAPAKRAANSAPAPVISPAFRK